MEVAGTRRSAWIVYAIVGVTSLPILLGYIWLAISTFSERTYGLIPVDHAGNLGGFTFSNWKFLLKSEIWLVTGNTLILALGLSAGVCAVSAMAGYSLSRLDFRGRRFFLTGTLLLQSFPSVTLLIAVYFVLRWLSQVPILGNVVGYDTLGGVILVSIAFDLPLGIWLMKGFFDAVSWDIERAALVDGCSRWRTWWSILLPQVRPGLFALAIFSFIHGWGSFLIPYSFMIDQKRGTIATYLQSLMSNTAPVNYNTVAAVGLFQLTPVLLFFFVSQKYLLKIFAGGSKGGT